MCDGSLGRALQVVDLDEQLARVDEEQVGRETFRVVVEALKNGAVFMLAWFVHVQPENDGELERVGLVHTLRLEEIVRVRTQLAYLAQPCVPERHRIVQQSNDL